MAGNADGRIVFEWSKLPEGSLVVDVGGGNGSQMMVIAKNTPKLRFMVQDREAVEPSAKEVC